jgi:hypothetical protein
MANDPPFATLNHFEGDSRTGESDFLRIGISCGSLISWLRVLPSYSSVRKQNKSANLSLLYFRTYGSKEKN